MGFGPKFLKLVKILYNDIRSCVKVNGHISLSFPVSRSVRQGCPIAALLYVMSVEPLRSLIMSHPNVRGIPIPFSTVPSVIYQHADDVTLTLNDLESVNQAFESIEVYCSLSGAKVNVEKSELLIAGSASCTTDMLNMPLRILNGSMLILGIYLGPNKLECESLNWNSKIGSIPSSWKVIIASECHAVTPYTNFGVEQPSGDVLLVSSFTAKNCYSILRNNLFVKPSSYVYFSSQGFNPDWPKVWKSVYCNLKSSEMIDNDFSICHNIVWTNSRKYVAHVIESPLCTLCKSNASETIIHVLCKCPSIKTFLDEIEDILLTLLLNVGYTTEQFIEWLLFGYPLSRSEYSLFLVLLFSTARLSIIKRRSMCISQARDVDLFSLFVHTFECHLQSILYKCGLETFMNYMNFNRFIKINNRIVTLEFT
ncbi:uncharacterized protein LOC130013192 [Patella vulgata]|uniref:uncharacterized protein LOC130013192 n=1 Tax=Patella vulgata TaxID=6465 RepID=UPI0024A96A2B|nr:uncharacterized protein LOC130013192 [Patella vulgata]